VIRDDDACAYTSPDVICSCYERIWADVPVSLSMTPFRIPGDDRHAPEHLKGSKEVLLLETNNELVSLVQDGVKQGYIDVALHGYNHVRYHGLPEFVAGENLEKKACEGKTYLDKLFGVNVVTFVPPNNAISSSGMLAFINAKMNLVGIPALWSGKYRHVNLRSLSLIPEYYWHEKFLRHKYPFILDLGDHKEISYHTVGPRSVARILFAELNYCYKHNGIFILSTHYHAFDRLTMDNAPVGNLVYELVEKASSYPNTEFVKINSIW